MKIPALSLIALALIFCAGARAADVAPPANNRAAPFALIPPAVVERLHEQAGSTEALAIIKSANEGMARAPRAMAVIHVEGTLPHQGTHDESNEAKKDWRFMLNSGLAYRLTGEKRYLDGVDRFLTAWLDVYKASFNPIDETDLDQIFLAYDLCSQGLPQPTRDKIETFQREIATGYLDRIDKQIASNKEDRANWQSHRIKLIVLAAYGTADDTLIARAEKAFRRQVSVNVLSDGAVVDFVKRDALHYVTYDLEPLCVAAIAAKRHGLDWFHGKEADGQSVALAVDWLTPYATGEKQHEEFVHSKVGFDATRAQAGMKGFSGLWDPAHSIALYQLASVLDPKYGAVEARVIKNTGGHDLGWLALLARAGL